jgi:hypothetical protein
VTLSPHPIVNIHAHSNVRADYYNYVRRLPSKIHCETLFNYFFSGINYTNTNCSLDEPIFREQLEQWWTAYDTILEQGPEHLSDDLRCFPALMFQILATSLQFLPPSYNNQLDELKFSALQSFYGLGVEYSECGVALSSLAFIKPSLVGVQQRHMRVWWSVYAGDMMRGWHDTSQTMK